jgi:UDP-N-acetylglucosamine 4,6-dehydratase
MYGLDKDRFLIIGGTGSLGQALVSWLDDERRHADLSCTVLSRDEIKQKELKARYPWVKTVIGDVTDKESLIEPISRADHVINLAAMKHIEVCEENPHRAHLVNFVGARNVAEVCEDVGSFSSCSLSSTDKAVLPINTYGLTKALAEKFYLKAAESGPKSVNRFFVFRWGNVLGSRGSVIHAFAKTLREEGRVYINHPEMTRFWIDIDDAADFMMMKIVSGSMSPLIIPSEIKASKIISLARATASVLGVDNYKVKLTDVRPGEKIHESLLLGDKHKQESAVTSQTAEQLTDKELEAMVRKALGL